MMPSDELERTRMRALSALLRQAACEALARGSLMAPALDEVRGELEHLLMLEVVEPMKRRRVVVRAEMMLDAWRGLSGSSGAAGAC